MIYVTEDFFNKTASEIRSIYFPDVRLHYSENPNYQKASYTIELFNNGCLTYRNLIGRLAKCCNDSTAKIHSIVEKYIVSFGQYQYTPKKS